MHKQKTFYQSVLLLFLAITLLSGCGGGGGGGQSTVGQSAGAGTVTGGSPTPGNTPARTTATIRIEQILARTVPDRVDKQSFVGLDGSGQITFGPLVLPKTAVIILSEVPIDTTEIRMELLNGTEVVGRAGVEVSLEAGQTLVLQDLPFEFVSVILKEIRVTPESSVLSAGFTTDLTATGIYEDDTQGDITSEVQWSAQNEEVASIDNAGNLTALKVGQTTITASLGELSDNAALEVTAAVPVSLRIEPETAQTTSEPVQFECYVLYSDGDEIESTDSVDWTLDTAEFVTNNDDGLYSPNIVTTVVLGPPNAVPHRSTKPGVTEVKATLGQLMETSTLTVNPADTVTGLTLVHRNGIITPGTTRQFRLIADFSDQPTRDITDETTWFTDTLENIVSLGNGAYSVGSDVPHGTAFTSKGSFGFQSVGPGHYVNRFAYAASGSENGAKSYNVTESGSLTAVNSRATGSGPTEIVMHPSGRLLYVLNATAGSISCSDISPTTGSLGPVDVVSNSFAPLSAVVTPDGSYLIVSSSTGILRFPAYGIGFPQNGTSKVSTGATALAIDPAGRFLYATSGGAVRVYSMDNLTTGSALTLLDNKSYAGPTGSGSLVVHPSGDYLYALSPTEDTITSFSVSSLGVLTELEPLTTGDFPFRAAFTPSGQYLYLTNLTDTTLSIFEVDTDGTLIVKPGFTVSSGTRSVAVDPGGLFAYITNSTQNTLSTYTIAADGSLTIIDSESVGTARGVATTP